MGITIGIDLGTTNSAVAIYENGQPKILENAQGKRTTPSVVAFKKSKANPEGEWIVGTSAKNQSAMNPLSTLYGVKRLIGRRFDEQEVQKMQALSSYKIVKGPNGDAWVEINGQAMAPAQVSAKVLREIKTAVEAYIGEEVTDAVITVPAYFNDAQRQATIDAGKIAGLDVKRIINEPTAAALAYGMDKKRGGKIAVFDLGGGTFDVSILEVMVDEEEGNNLVSVKSTNGDTFLGGENFDEIVTEFLIKQLNEEHKTGIDLKDAASRAEHAHVIQRFRETAEKAKIDLSRENSVDVLVPMIQTDDGIINFEYALTRTQLEKLLKSQIDKTIEPCRKALEDAGLKASDIDEVILVGGQTRMPLVVSTVKGFFGKEPKRDVNPDEIVAMGAAVQGAVLTGAVSNVLLVDVIPLSIGIRNSVGEMTVLLPRNTTIPTEYKDSGWSTVRDNQRDVEIMIYQGERPKADDNKLLGKFTLDGIPPAKAGTPNLELTLDIDADGMITASAKDLKTGRAVGIKIEPNGGLTEAQLAAMLKDAEENAEADRAFRETAAAVNDATAELKAAEEDTEYDYFKEAPEDLKTLFAQAVEELTAAKAEKNVAAMVEKTAKLSEVRSQFGEAANNNASSETPAEDLEAGSTDNTNEGSEPPAPKGPGM